MRCLKRMDVKRERNFNIKFKMIKATAGVISWLPRFVSLITMKNRIDFCLSQPAWE